MKRREDILLLSIADLNCLQERMKEQRAGRGR